MNTKNTNNLSFIFARGVTHRVQIHVSTLDTSQNPPIHTQQIQSHGEGCHSRVHFANTQRTRTTHHIISIRIHTLTWPPSESIKGRWATGVDGQSLCVCVRLCITCRSGKGWECAGVKWGAEGRVRYRIGREWVTGWCEIMSSCFVISLAYGKGWR